MGEVKEVGDDEDFDVETADQGDLWDALELADIGDTDANPPVVILSGSGALAILNASPFGVRVLA